MVYFSDGLRARFEGTCDGTAWSVWGHYPHEPKVTSRTRCDPRGWIDGLPSFASKELKAEVAEALEKVRRVFIALENDMR